jgi:hypothetical protein
MRGPFRISVRAIVIAVATTTLLASCGSSTAKSSAGSGTSSSSSPSSGSKQTSATTVKSFSGSGSGDFCSLVHGSADKVTSATLPPNPLDWKTAFQNLQKSLNEVKAKAPAEIKGDLDTISNAYNQLVTAIDNANGNLAQVGSTLQSTFTSTDFKTAITNLKNYLTNVCHLPLPTTPST